MTATAPLTSENLNNWDPALVDALARDRRVVTFDNAGVGGIDGHDRTDGAMP